VFTAFTVPDTGKSYPALALVVLGYTAVSVLYPRAVRRLARRPGARLSAAPAVATDS